MPDLCDFASTLFPKAIYQQNANPFALAATEFENKLASVLYCCIADAGLMKIL